MANSCLKNFKNLQTRSLVGAKIHDSINSSSPLRFGGDAGQVCILSRSNLALFQKVVEIIGCHKTEVPTNPLKIFIVGVCCCLLFLFKILKDLILSFFFYVESGHSWLRRACGIRSSSQRRLEK